MAFKSSKWDFLISHLFFAAAMLWLLTRYDSSTVLPSLTLELPAAPLLTQDHLASIHTAFIRGNLSGNVTYIELFGPHSSCHNYPKNYLRAEG